MWTCALADVRSGAAVGEPIVQGALRAQAAIAALTDTWTRAPRQALARLHTLAASGPGRCRACSGRPTAGAERLDTLAAVLATTRAPAIVVAAIVHGEILSLDAFAPVSGIVARAAARLDLDRAGPRPEVARGARGRTSRAAGRLRRRRWTPTRPATSASGLRHCSAAVVAGAREAIAICEAILRG